VRSRLQLPLLPAPAGVLVRVDGSDFVDFLGAYSWNDIAAYKVAKAKISFAGLAPGEIAHDRGVVSVFITAAKPYWDAEADGTLNDLLTEASTAAVVMTGSQTINDVVHKLLARSAAADGPSLVVGIMIAKPAERLLPQPAGVLVRVDGSDFVDFLGVFSWEHIAAYKSADVKTSFVGLAPADTVQDPGVVSVFVTAAEPCLAARDASTVNLLLADASAAAVVMTATQTINDVVHNLVANSTAADGSSLVVGIMIAKPAAASERRQPG